MQTSVGVNIFRVGYLDLHPLSLSVDVTITLVPNKAAKLFYHYRPGHTGERICNGGQTDKNVKNLVIR